MKYITALLLVACCKLAYGSECEHNSEYYYKILKEFVNSLKFDNPYRSGEYQTISCPKSTDDFNSLMGMELENCEEKRYSKGSLEASKWAWAQVAEIYGYSMICISSTHVVLVLNTHGLGKYSHKKRNAEIRFYKEDGNWRINEIGFTLNSHNKEEVIDRLTN